MFRPNDLQRVLGSDDDIGGRHSVHGNILALDLLDKVLLVVVVLLRICYDCERFVNQGVQLLETLTASFAKT